MKPILITGDEYEEITKFGISSKPLPIQNWHRFAEDCYKNRTVREMILALQLPPNPQDCGEWDITKSEWRRALIAALAAKAHDYRNRW
jgi:hypothetical protein